MSPLEILIIILIFSILLLIIVIIIFIKIINKQTTMLPSNIPMKNYKQTKEKEENKASNVHLNIDYSYPVIEEGDFSIIMVDPGPNKIRVIKEIRTVTVLGLKEAKDIADTPNSTILSNISQDNAEEIKARFNSIGAIVDIVECKIEGINAGNYAVILNQPGQFIIDTIKEIRSLTGKDLKEVKNIVENTPSLICSTVSQEFAGKVKKRLEQYKASVMITTDDKIYYYLQKPNE